MKTQLESGDGDTSASARWPAVLALIAIGVIQYALPARLKAGPDWLLLVLIIALSVPALIAHQVGRRNLNFVLSLITSVIVTAALIWSVTMLIAGLPGKKETAGALARSAVGLWFSNILVFASWYWKLDACGPNERDATHRHTDGDFLFPQMTLSPPQADNYRGWKPGFVDYLFLAFNTSAAFSPSDTPILSRWAKALMMVQSVISLGIIAILAARAISVL